MNDDKVLFDPCPPPHPAQLDRAGLKDNGPSKFFYETAEDMEQPRLRITSLFESGNLAYAVQVGKNLNSPADRPRKNEGGQLLSPLLYYDLYLDFDPGTRGYTQWFYFAVQALNLPRGSKIQFRIRNLTKPCALYEGTAGEPMCPVAWSYGCPELGWTRGGGEVKVFRSLDDKEPLVRVPTLHHAGDIFLAQDQEHVQHAEGTSHGLTNRHKGRDARNWWTLQFSYVLEVDDDTVCFAFHYPYTCTHLGRVLRAVERKANAAGGGGGRGTGEERLVVRRHTLCESAGGLPCEMLEAFGAAIADDSPEDSDRTASSKPAVFLLARAHPGESNGSIALHGFLLFLFFSEDAKHLRANYHFFILPMLNPDGVAFGTTRCCLSGFDLNRQFVKPSKQLHPTAMAGPAMVNG
eukprot:g3713.t1